MLPFITLCICIVIPTLSYLAINRQILKMALKPSNKTTFHHLYNHIAYSIMAIGAPLTFLLCIPLMQQPWGILNGVPFIILYLIIATLVQGIIWILCAPDKLHRPIKAVLPITIMANGVGIVVVLLLMPLLLWAIGIIYSSLYSL